MARAELDKTNRCLLADYQQAKPFASFLPGIAGPLGIPIWAFYVNRGQAIASFGVESKDSPIVEFQPANKAYQLTPTVGFRTFLKLTSAGSGGTTRFYEPFAPWSRSQQARQGLAVGANELELTETNPAQGLKTSVLYYTLPGEAFGGLVRRLTLQNISALALSFDLLDGLPAVIPYGVNNGLLKEIGRTCEAWMEVFNREASLPFYRLRASVIDRVEVEIYQAGHFALACVGGKLLPVLVDPAAVFEADTSIYRPLGFERQSLDDLLSAPQVTCGRTPCAFFAHQGTLIPGESVSIDSLYGHAGGLELLEKFVPRLLQADYFERKYHEAVKLADDLTDVVATRTADPLLDAYCRQNFLDNVLRGGWPLLLGDKQHPHVYPVYSRKHGDLERDYNAFWITPEPYSQGEGSYRDVAQNRRDNVRLNPAVGDADIRTFMSLIQIDGYNPRTLRGSSFSLTLSQQEKILTGFGNPGRLVNLLARPFTPGRLLKVIAEDEIALPGGEPFEAFLSAVLAQAEQHIEAEFFEGYWIDHWEYNLDLVESYLSIYPDRQDALLFGAANLPFFDSPAGVQPRSCKYVLTASGPRQVGSLLEDPEKAALIAARPLEKNWLRTRHGLGEIYRASLFAKLGLVALLKFASLDPWGMGIEMEASRPGWYDALNGLPALFGSGMAESYELQRWLAFLRSAIHAHLDGLEGGKAPTPGPPLQDATRSLKGEVRFPLEAVELLRTVMQALYTAQPTPAGDFLYWDAVSTAREVYRSKTRLGIDGAELSLPLSELDACLERFQAKLAAGAARAESLTGGLPPTYFTFTLDSFQRLAERDPQGRPYIRPEGFTAHPLPLFLEGPVKAFNTRPDKKSARELYLGVKASPLYDRPLKMYRVNASLEAWPQDIGRARAFPPGWLENESIWLHMEYKYLLETLRAGLYPEFFEDLRQALVPYLDPAVYGRSPLENSSFLASSAHPDPSLHGAGFVARLSGSTAEFLSIWTLMLAGARPFQVLDGQLCLALQPVLPGWLFSEGGQVSFRFLGHCKVTYHNPHRLDIFGPGVQVQRSVLYESSASSILAPGPVIGAPYAERVRNGIIDRIEVYF
jgi:hypothetical protein